MEGTQMVTFANKAVRLRDSVAVIALLLATLTLVYWFTPAATSQPQAAAGLVSQSAGAKFPAVTTFLSDDASQGVAVTFRLARDSFQNRVWPDRIEIQVQAKDRLAAFWEVRQAADYVRDGGRRRIVFRGGPAYVENSTPRSERLWHVWEMYNLEGDEYELDVCLQKRKDGMPVSEVRRAIREQDALDFKVQPLG
jgi:hypothetical protein